MEKNEDLKLILHCIEYLTTNRYCKGESIYSNKVIEMGMSLSTLYEPIDRRPYYRRMKTIAKQNDLPYFINGKLDGVKKVLREEDEKEYNSPAFTLFKLFCDNAEINYHKDEFLLDYLRECHKHAIKENFSIRYITNLVKKRLGDDWKTKILKS